MLTAILMSALAMFSCGSKNKPTYERIVFERIGSSGWDPSHTVWFEPLLMDSSLVEGATYKIDLIFRFSERHETLPMPVVIEMETPESTLICDTLTLGLKDTKYRIEENRSYGVKELTVPIAGDLKLTSGFALGVHHLMRKDQTRGILNVGIRIYR